MSLLSPRNPVVTSTACIPVVYLLFRSAVTKWYVTVQTPNYVDFFMTQQIFYFFWVSFFSLPVGTHTG